LPKSSISTYLPFKTAIKYTCLRLILPIKEQSKNQLEEILVCSYKKPANNNKKRETVAGNAETGISAFIFNDMPIEKTERLIEGISLIWNHVLKSTY